MNRIEQNPCVIWFTGLSGSGKSTLAIALEKKMKTLGYAVYGLDGDKIRSGLNKDLSFKPMDRSENIRRIAELAVLFMSAGMHVIGSFIAPYEKDREFIKKRVGTENFIEVYVSTSLTVCEQRDAKGLYKKAREGKIKNFTGIDAPYETPKSPDIIIDTEILSTADAVSLLLNYSLKRIQK